MYTAIITLILAGGLATAYLLGRSGCLAAEQRIATLEVQLAECRDVLAGHRKTLAALVKADERLNVRVDSECKRRGELRARLDSCEQAIGTNAALIRTEREAIVSRLEDRIADIERDIDPAVLEQYLQQGRQPRVQDFSQEKPF